MQPAAGRPCQSREPMLPKTFFQSGIILPYPTVLTDNFLEDRERGRKGSRHDSPNRSTVRLDFTTCIQQFLVWDMFGDGK